MLLDDFMKQASEYLASAARFAQTQRVDVASRQSCADPER
jgi:hypothetical protein